MDINWGRHHSIQFCKCRHSLALLSGMAFHGAVPCSSPQKCEEASTAPQPHTACPWSLGFLSAWYLTDRTAVSYFSQGQSECVFLGVYLYIFLPAQIFAHFFQWVVILVPPFSRENSTRIFLSPFMLSISV